MAFATKMQHPMLKSDPALRERKFLTKLFVACAIITSESMTQQSLELSSHSKSPNWYQNLPQPKKFDASNSLTCHNCQQILGYTWQKQQYGVITATTYADWWKEMEKCK